MLRLVLALALFAPAASAQGFWAEPDDDWTIADGPPVLAGSTMEETASEIGRALRDQADDSWTNRLIWWMANNLSGHIPVDPNCPPPDGCPPADDAPPAGGTPPAGGEPPAGESPPADAPPAGSPPADTGTSPTDTAEPQALSSADGTATFRLGDRAQALAVRARFDGLAEGAFVPGAQLPGGARLRVVSKREAVRADRAEFQLRLEVVPRGARAQATPVLVQAGAGQLLARVADGSASPARGARRAGDAAPSRRAGDATPGRRAGDVAAPGRRARGDGAPTGRRGRR